MSQRLKKNKKKLKKRNLIRKSKIQFLYQSTQHFNSYNYVLDKWMISDLPPIQTKPEVDVLSLDSSNFTRLTYNLIDKTQICFTVK